MADQPSKEALELAEKLPCGGGLCAEYVSESGVAGVAHSKHCPAFYRPAVASALQALMDENAELRAKLSAPEIHDFASGVVLESAHQRERWAGKHDAGKSPADWFWLIGYLAQKAMTAQMAGDTEKALHHTISTAAALANWHCAISGTDNRMRPGIDAEARGHANI